ncbi:MAG: hypothetical protein ACR2IF_16715 [Terriglobales bacterium]
MKHRTQITFVFSIALVLCLAGAILLLRRVDQLRSGATLEEVLYIPSPKALKRMSLGYDGLMADIYWTRAVQYFGSKHAAQSKQYKLLAPLLDITTELDPHLIVAYQFGSTFLAQKPPEGAGMPDKAVDLVERGIRSNPDNWHLYYELGFLEYMELHNPRAAAQAFERGSRVPHAHPFLKIIAAAMAQHAGEADMARMLWNTTYQTNEDKQIRANALKHLRALDVDDVITALESAIARYKSDTHRDPSTWSELVERGYLRRIPVDPVGHTYKLMPGGRVEVEDPDSLPFINKGLPPGKEPSLIQFEKSKS